MSYWFKSCSCTVVALTLLALPLGAWAQAGAIDSVPEQQQTKLFFDTTEYGGLITSQAATSLGHYFHAKFSEAWSDQRDAEAYVLAVREKSSPRAGTEVQIVFNDAIVYRAVLPRNYSAVASLASTAAETVYKRVVDIGLQAVLFSDPDIAKSAY